MSATKISCPTCASVLQLPPGNTATRFRCSRCKGVIDTTTVAVPMPVARPVAMEVPMQAASPFDFPDQAQEPEPPPRERPRKDDTKEKRQSGYTRRDAKREPMPKRKIALTILAGVLLLVSLATGAYFFVREPEKEPVKKEPTPAATPPKTTAKAAPPKEENLTPEQVIRKVKSSTVYIRTHLDENLLGSGSGFFAGNKPGYVVTNAHVIGYGPFKVRVPMKVEVVIDSGENEERTLVAKIIGLDVELDVAVLKIEDKNLPKPLKFGKAEQLSEAQNVIIFGYPFGENLGKNISVNRTTVSSLRKTGMLVDVVQLAGGLNSGNSGGPVVNEKGEVIGVSVAKLRGTDSIAFAIPAETVDRFVDDQLTTGGDIRLGYLKGATPKPKDEPAP